jgi:O-antigen/teichoic acid export membrane protein
VTSLNAFGADNRRIAERAMKQAKPLASLWAGAAVAVLLGAAGQFLFARALGPSGYGVIATANAIANIAGPFAAFGVGLMLIQKHGSEGWGALRWVSRSLRVSAICTLLATLVFVIWAATSMDTAAERSAALMLFPLVAAFAGVQLAESRFQLEHRYLHVARWAVLKQLATFGVAVLAILWSWTLIDAAAGLAVGSALLAVFALWAGSAVGKPSFLLKGHGPRPDVIKDDAPRYRTILSEMWPFAATSAVFLFFFQSSLVVVHWIAGSHDAGLYGLAVSVMTAVYLLPRILYRKFFLAKVARWHYHDYARVLAFTWRIVPALGLLAIPLALIIALAAPVFVTAVAGQEFRASALVLQILCLAIPFRFVSAGLAVAAVETAHVRERVVWQFVIAVAAIGATIAVLPTYSIVGAATVMAGAEAVLATAYWVLAARNRAPAAAAPTPAVAAMQD